MKIVAKYEYGKVESFSIPTAVYKEIVEYDSERGVVEDLSGQMDNVARFFGRLTEVLLKHEVIDAEDVRKLLPSFTIQEL
jgi:hypothetical protein